MAFYITLHPLVEGVWNALKSTADATQGTQGTRLLRFTPSVKEFLLVQE